MGQSEAIIKTNNFDINLDEEFALIPGTKEEALANKDDLGVVIGNYETLLNSGGSYSDNSNIKISLAVYIQAEVVLSLITQDYIVYPGEDSSDFYVVMESTAPKLLSDILYEVENDTQTFAQTKADMGVETVNNMINLLEENDAKLGKSIDYLTEGGKNLPEDDLTSMIDSLSILREEYLILYNALIS